MQGPTGVGKTEIARRLAKLVKAPFVKVEATKYTEVGYVGRDCESMIRDLVEVSVRLVKEEKLNEVREKAKNVVNTKLADILENTKKDDIIKQYGEYSREKLIEKLDRGEYDNEIIEIQISAQAKPIGVMGGGMATDMDFSNVLGSIFPPQKKLKKVSIS